MLSATDKSFRSSGDFLSLSLLDSLLDFPIDPREKNEAVWEFALARPRFFPSPRFNCSSVPTYNSFEIRCSMIKKIKNHLYPIRICCCTSLGIYGMTTLNPRKWHRLAGFITKGFIINNIFGREINLVSEHPISRYRKFIIPGGGGLTKPSATSF